MSWSRNALIHNVKHVVWRCTTRERISEQIGNRQNIRLQIRENARSRELVKLHNCKLSLWRTLPRGVLCKRACKAAGNIAANAVGNGLVAIIGEKIVEQVVGGCLAVCAGNKDNLLWLSNVSQKCRINAFSDKAWQCSAFMVSQFKCCKCCFSSEKSYRK